MEYVYLADEKGVESKKLVNFMLEVRCDTFFLEIHISIWKFNLSQFQNAIWGGGVGGVKHRICCYLESVEKFAKKLIRKKLYTKK
jgi:hypothetical protein